MHNPESDPKKETHKLLRSFEIQVDHLISARRPDLIIINNEKRTCKIVDFVVPANHRVKLKESEKKDKYLDLAKELKKKQNMKMTVIPILISALSTVPKGLVKGLENLEKNWISGDHPNYNIIKIGQNTEKSPGDLRRLAVTQTLVKAYQLTLI